MNCVRRRESNYARTLREWRRRFHAAIADLPGMGFNGGFIRMWDYYEGQEGFNERQGVLLQANLAVDGEFIGAGTRVDSHMIFLNLRDVSTTWHSAVMWTFSGKILGVMSDSSGSLEAASTPILGAFWTTYPVSAFRQRGMESNDGYSGVGTNTLNVKMHVIQPGDWIRVVTEHHVIPEPASLWLLGIGLVGLFAERRLGRFR